jgi:hypothetical protein
MRWALLAALLAGCGGPLPWAGKWKQENPPPGAGLQLTLTGSGTTIRGTGVEFLDPAGIERTFTVSGTSVPGPGVTFAYADDSTEGFFFSQPDATHITLMNERRRLDLTRQ